MASDSALLRLCKPTGLRSAKEYYYDVWINYQLAWDERRNGRITRASIANRQQPLLQLPAELRNLIWEYVLAPQFHPDDPFSLHALDQISYGEACAQYLAERTVDLFPRRKGVYPHHAIVLISRNSYEETLTMYQAAVDRYYQKIPQRVKAWANSPQDAMSSTANQKIAAIRDADLAQIRTLVIDCCSVCSKPEMLFTNGAWRASWQRASGYANQPDLIVRRHVVLYDPSRSSAIIEALEKQGLDTDEYLQRGEKCHRDKKYDCSMEVVMFPYDIRSETLRPIRAAAMSTCLTKKILQAVLYFRCYMSGRH